MSSLRIAVFLMVVTSITAAIHGYLWMRLVKDPQLPIFWSRLTTLTLVALAVSIPLSFITMRLWPRPVAAPLAWLASMWMGTMFLLLVLSIAADGLRLLAWGASVLGAPAADAERRLWLKRVLAGLIGVGGLGLGGLSVFNARRGATVKRILVPLGKLPEQLAGLRIVQITDLHVGPTIGRGFVQAVVDRCNGLQPDVVAITGDLVDGSVAELAEHVAPLAHLRATHGVFFVTGNHEYYSGAQEWVAHLQTLGIRVLRNEHVSIERQGARLHLAGIDDWSAHEFGGGHGADLPKALAGRDPSAPVVLLAHQPRAILEAAKLGVDLQLSGHTHGGQIKPFNALVKLQQPYVVGLHRHQGSWIYVSGGTGYWGPPMRLGVASEISCIELQSA